MTDSFLDDVFADLAREALALLPEGCWRHGYSHRSFSFLRRTGDGRVYLHRSTTAPLEAVRRGFGGPDSFEVTEITPETWRPSYGLAGAPDGTYVECTNYARGLDDERSPRASYGVVRGGRYHRLHGTNWAFGHTFYTPWTHGAEEVILNHKGAWIRTKPESCGWPDLYAGDVPTGPNADLEVWAHRINEKILTSPLLSRRMPSPHYYDPTRWTYTPGEGDAPGVWRFD